MTNLYIFKTKKKNIASLQYRGNSINCFVGENGIGRKTREGDKITPRGEFKLLKIFYREDKVDIPKTSIPSQKINKNSFGVLTPKLNVIILFVKKQIIYFTNIYTEKMIFMILLSPVILMLVQYQGIKAVQYLYTALTTLQNSPRDVLHLKKNTLLIF